MLTPLFSAQFTEIYHQNYEDVERIVLVFDSNPQYVIQEETAKVKVIVYQPDIDFKLNSENVNNNVLKTIDFTQSDNNLIVNFALAGATDIPYLVKSFELIQSNYKLVLDIFRYAKPDKPEIYLNYAKFYNDVGLPSKSNLYKAKADSLSSALAEAKLIKPSITKEEIQDRTKQQATSTKEVKQPKENKKRPKRDVLSIFASIKPIYWIPFFALILILVITLIIHFTPDKKRQDKKVKPKYRAEEGFGTEEFRVNMIKNMLKSGWGESEIAKELMISKEEVQRLSDLIEE